MAGPTGPGFAAGYDTYVPNFDASGRLIVSYTRNVNLFAVNKYVQIVNTPRNVGYWLKISAQEAARVVTTQDFQWPDGQMRPMRTGLEAFNYFEFRTQRYDYGFTIGHLAAEQADWPIVEEHAGIHLAQMMTNRTNRVLTVLTTASNWQAATANDFDLAQDHTSTATAEGGGQWDLGASTTPFIKKTLDSIAVKINQDTLGVVNGDPQQLMVIISPRTARLMAESAEIHDYIKGSYWTQEELTQGLHPNNKYGLPSSIYGYQIIVENTIKVTTRKGASITKTTAMPDQQAVVLSRIGGIDGNYGTPSFSTMTLFAYEEMSIEKFDDPKNRLTEAHIVEDTAEILTAPASGWLITSLTSV